jgi:hypothetical protein
LLAASNRTIRGLAFAFCPNCFFLGAAVVLDACIFSSVAVVLQIAIQSSENDFAPIVAICTVEIGISN